MRKIGKALSFDEAYDAMVDYLEKYYNRGKSDDIAMLAGDLLILEDGESADPAAIIDWKESVGKILNRNPQFNEGSPMMDNDKKLSIDEAYDAMIDYLEGYYSRGKSDDIGALLSGMLLFADGGSADPALMSDWQESVEKILKQNPRERPYLRLMNDQSNEQ